MENKPSFLLKLFAFIGVLATIAAIVYAVYKYLTPEYLEDTEDDFDDDFEDYFENEDAAPEDFEDEEAAPAKEEAADAAEAAAEA